MGDRYVLTRRLGAGGMGVVYAATHEITGREVAIKLLHVSGRQTDEATARFAREARTAAAIGHPNIVEILDAGTLPDGTPFLVMEQLRGETLGHLLWRSKRLTPERVADIVSQAALALTALHARGVIHRDVKTDNLFVTEDGRVKLLDFGLAVFTDPALDARVTQDGVFNGTPQYMPPEVFDGGDPSGTWDVYGLATVAFELLTGRLPFEEANPVVMLCAKRETTAPRLSDCCDARFSDAIERVMRRGLERDPALRHSTPVAFGDQLGRAIWGDADRSGQRPVIATSLAAASDALDASTRPTRAWVPPAALLVGACAGLLIGGATWTTRSEASAAAPEKMPAECEPQTLAAAEATAPPTLETIELDLEALEDDMPLPRPPRLPR